MKANTAVFLCAALVLAVIHYIALALSLYWLYPWLDIVTHALGGAAVALGWFTARDFIPRLPASYFGIVPVLSLVFLVAVAWEIFEVAIGIPFYEAGYVTDTVIDLCVGLAGGVPGYIVAKRLYEDL